MLYQLALAALSLFGALQSTLSLFQDASLVTSTPLLVPEIEIEAGTPDKMSPTSSR